MIILIEDFVSTDLKVVFYRLFLKLDLGRQQLIIGNLTIFNKFFYRTLDLPHTAGVHHREQIIRPALKRPSLIAMTHDRQPGQLFARGCDSLL